MGLKHARKVLTCWFPYFRFVMPLLLQEIASGHTLRAMRTKSPAKFVASFCELPTWRTTSRNTVKERTTTVAFATKVCLKYLSMHRAVTSSSETAMFRKIFSWHRSHGHPEDKSMPQPGFRIRLALLCVLRKIREVIEMNKGPVLFCF